MDFLTIPCVDSDGTWRRGALTARLKFTLADGDSDGIPDWWENLYADAGLSPTNSADVWLDPDGDGLINLHEYWADCDPLVYDGTNTAIYAAVHSIDDRLMSTNSEGRLKYYASIGSSSVVANTNCWAKDLDGMYIYASVPDSAMRFAYYEYVIPGDSGHHRFLAIGGSVILLDCVQGGPYSPGVGPSVLYYSADIRQAIESFGDTNTWTMTEFDLTPYDELPNYHH